MTATYRHNQLEFTKILERIASHGNGEPTRLLATGIAPLPSVEAVRLRLGQVEEIRSLRRQGVPLPLFSYTDIEPLVREVAPEGSILSPLDLAAFMPVLRMMRGISRQFAYRSDVPLLRERFGTIAGFPDLLDELEISIDEEGNIPDSASPLLSDMRGRRRGLAGRIRKRLEEIVRERHVALFLQDDFITQRGGRWVLPVRMDSKGMVAGVVHDVSNSGETAFMEPLEIIPLANEMENLGAEIRAEELRIIRGICRMIRQESDEMLRQYRLMVELDLFHAVSVLADEVGGNVPEISAAKRLSVRGGRHPYLALLHRDGNCGRVVPLDIELRGDAAVIVVTGPNAGGKTIALKTVGLLLLMALSGIPVPAGPDSVFPMADSLLVDIGDDQSVERGLSTFAAHVSNIGDILRRAGDGSLVLLDELGTGTEPVQGAALACAILDELRRKGALVVATTHLTDIVGYVERADGMVNASMEFDAHSYLPLYRLRMGAPGVSHALEIAARYGIPEQVVQAARGMVGNVQADFRDLVIRLQDQAAELERRLEEAKAREAEIEERRARIEQAAERAREEQRQRAAEGLRQAKDLVAQARREGARILDEIKRTQTREPLKKLEQTERDLMARLADLEEAPLAPDELREGMKAFSRSLGYDGEIVRVDTQRGRVRFKAGTLEVDLAADDLRKRVGKEVKREERRPRQKMQEEPEADINLVGLRVPDALTRLDAFMERAVEAHLPEVKIIHGIGTGALLRAVRDYLQGHSAVAEVRGGEPAEGGGGVTFARLA